MLFPCRAGLFDNKFEISYRLRILSIKSCIFLATNPARGHIPVPTLEKIH